MTNTDWSYLPSARVYMQQILYDKFSYDKFNLLVWTCQQVYFDNLLVASNVIVIICYSQIRNVRICYSKICQRKVFIAAMTEKL
jgi:hypothetical protein